MSSIKSTSYSIQRSPSNHEPEPSASALAPIVPNPRKIKLPYPRSAGRRSIPHLLLLPAIMVNFHDPDELARDYAALVKIAAITDGIYVWEYFITLGYEWDVIRGRRPYRRTIWIYSIARLATLASVTMDLIMNNTNLTDCQAVFSINWVFSDIALAFSSLLIFLRVPPIWGKNKIVVSLAAFVWVSNAALLVLDSARVRSTWVPEEQSCSTPRPGSSKPTVISVFATDFLLLLITLAGLLRMRREGGGFLGLGWLLWKQGVIWILIATIADIFPVIFLYLNLNDAFAVMFMLPALVTMSIAATRMYRALAKYGSQTHITTSESSGPRLPSAALAIDTHNRMEVAVHTTYDQYMPSLRDKNVSFVGTEGRPHDDKSHELSLHEDAGSNA